MTVGLSIDFSKSVTKYLPPREKEWRTMGEPRLLMIASYEMHVARLAAVTVGGAADELDRLPLVALSFLADRVPVSGSTV